MNITLNNSRKILAFVWFSVASIIFFLIFLQNIFEHYGETYIAVWSWIMPSLLPTSFLLTCVLVAPLNDETKNKKIDFFKFLFCLLLSIAYLFVLLLLIILQPLSDIDPLKLFQDSGIYLGPFQGLITIALCYFFFFDEFKNQ